MSISPFHDVNDLFGEGGRRYLCLIFVLRGWGYIVLDICQFKFVSDSLHFIIFWLNYTNLRLK